MDGTDRRAITGGSLADYVRQTPQPERVQRYSIATPEKSQIHTFAVSPDGQYLAIAASVEGKRRLYIRSLDSLTPQELRGTEDATYPFWSPDSRAIGFFAGGKLKRIGVDGAALQILCDAPEARGGTWNRDGVIVFAPNIAGSLQRVAAVGGVPVDVTKVAEREVHRFPSFLPDGRRFLYLSTRGPQRTAGIHVASLDGQTPRLLLADPSSAFWVPHASRGDIGYILFTRGRTLMAQPSDAKTLQPAGEVFPVAEQVSLQNVHYVQASVSPSGLLVYWTGGESLDHQLTWYDRSGKPLSNVGTPAGSLGLALSPDEKTAALTRFSQGQGSSDIWLRELARGVDTRFTFDSAASRAPVWSPDGRRIVYSSARDGSPSLFLKETSGTGKDDMLLKPTTGQFACDWSKDGRTLVYVENSKSLDLWTLNMEGDRKPAPFANTTFNETQCHISSDGRWISYASDESGRYEIYVRPFPSGPGKWKISINGGELPRWRQDGKELFFISPEGTLMAAAVKAVPDAQLVVSAEVPQLLFDGRLHRYTPGYNFFPYSVASDGKRFLALTPPRETAETPLTVVVNWLAGLKK
jgi:Tol biopolymer transport system component